MGPLVRVAYKDKLLFEDINLLGKEIQRLFPGNNSLSFRNLGATFVTIVTPHIEKIFLGFTYPYDTAS
jgi:hypothetical protein